MNASDKPLRILGIAFEPRISCNFQVIEQDEDRNPRWSVVSETRVAASGKSSLKEVLSEIIGTSRPDAVALLAPPEDSDHPANSSYLEVHQHLLDLLAGLSERIPVELISKSSHALALKNVQDQDETVLGASALALASSALLPRALLKGMRQMRQNEARMHQHFGEETFREREEERRMRAATFSFSQSSPRIQILGIQVQDSRLAMELIQSTDNGHRKILQREVPLDQAAEAIRCAAESHRPDFAAIPQDMHGQSEPFRELSIQQIRIHRISKEDHARSLAHKHDLAPPGIPLGESALALAEASLKRIREAADPRIQKLVSQPGQRIAQALALLLGRNFPEEAPRHLRFLMEQAANGEEFPQERKILGKALRLLQGACTESLLFLGAADEPPPDVWEERRQAVLNHLRTLRDRIANLQELAKSATGASRMDDLLRHDLLRRIHSLEEERKSIQQETDPDSAYAMIQDPLQGTQ